MKLTKMDQRVLEDLGLDKLPDDKKQQMLKRLDDALLNRFMANILTTLPKEKQDELEKKLEDTGADNPEKAFEEAINLHPDAKTVLEDSAQEIIAEYKKADRAEKTAPTTPPAESATPPNDTAPASDSAAANDTAPAETPDKPEQDEPEKAPLDKTDTSSQPTASQPPDYYQAG